MRSSSLVIYNLLIVILGISLSYALPQDDPKTPVVVLAYEGGFTSPRVNNEPDLQILADGTVILGAPFGQKKRIETKIELQRLQQLLKFLLDEQQFAKFNAQKVQDLVQAEQKKQGRAIAIDDAATTVIRIHADGKTVQARFYGLPMMAQQFPAVTELGQLEAARKHLEKLRAEVYAGGKQGVTHYLNLANQQLKEKYSSVSLLTTEDLRNAWQFSNGNTHVSFARDEQVGGGRSRFTSVTINIPSGENPRVVAVVNEGIKK